MGRRVWPHRREQIIYQLMGLEKLYHFNKRISQAYIELLSYSPFLRNECVFMPCRCLPDVWFVYANYTLLCWSVGGHTTNTVQPTSMPASTQHGRLQHKTRLYYRRNDNIIKSVEIWLVKVVYIALTLQ